MTHIRLEHPPAALGAALALAATVLLPGTAQGAATGGGPLFTDPVGDVRLFGSDCFVSLLSECVPAGPAVAAPAADVVAGDMSTDGTTLEWSLDLLDLEDPTATTDAYVMSVSVTANVRIYAEATRSAVASDGRLSFGAFGPFEPVPVMFDNATNRVTWRVPLEQLNRYVALACPECKPWRHGTVLEDITAAGATGAMVGDRLVFSFPLIDRASTTSTYRIGA